MSNQILARLGVVMGVDSGELEIGLNAAKEKFKGFTQEVKRQTNEAAKQTMALKMATESYGKTLTEVEKLELELKYGRMAGNMVEEKTLSLLRQQAAAYDAVKAAADKANKAKSGGLTAQQQAALGYQTTDIVTSLAGGQNPFMVLLQQGGQLKDQFGGFKPMFAGIAEAITLTKVAVVGLGGSIAALAYAMYKGSEEQKAFNNSLILTGGYLNMTEKQFTALSQTISSKYHTSLSDTREAMQSVVSSGRFTGTAIASVSGLIAQMSRLTGESAANLATSLIPSLDGSAASAKRLNEQYHFLTVEQYNQIRALNAQGKSQEAIKLTTDAWSASLAKQKDELNALGKAWRSVSEAFDSYLQKFKEIGKKEAPEDTLARLRNRMEYLRQSDQSYEPNRNAYEQAREAVKIMEQSIAREKELSDKKAAEALKAERRINQIASGEDATRRAKRFELEKLINDEKFNLSIESMDKISEIDARRLKERSDASLQYKKMNLDEEFKFTVENADLLKKKLEDIDAKAKRDKEEVYAKARESYRVAAQAEQDAVDKERERIEFYKEHLFLQGDALKIAETRLATEQKIAELYAKKDSGSESDKQKAADRLRDIQKQREAVIEQGTHLKMLQDMNQSVYGSMSAAVDNFVRNGKFAFKDFTRSVIQNLLSIAMQAQMMSLFKGFDFFGAGKFTPGSNSFVGPMPMTASAVGGPLSSGQASIVGENGPEIFVPKGAGTIIPNTGDLSGLNMGQSVVYNGPYIANMSAIDTQSGIQFLTKNKQAVWAANQSAQRSLPASR